MWSQKDGLLLSAVKQNLDWWECLKCISDCLYMGSLRAKRGDGEEEKGRLDRERRNAERKMEGRGWDKDVMCEFVQNIGRAVAADNCKREINWDRAALLMLCRRSFPSLLGSDCIGFIHLTACNKKQRKKYRQSAAGAQLGFISLRRYFTQLDLLKSTNRGVNHGEKQSQLICSLVWLTTR